jgi:hypothetical protein
MDCVEGDTRKKYFLKTQILRNPQLDDDNKIVIDKVQDFKCAPRTGTLNIGIVTTIIYFISISWIYFTAYANCDKRGIFKNFPPRNYSKPFNRCKNLIGHKTSNDSFTLSYAMLYSDRYLSTFLITTTFVMIAILLIQQNFAVTGEGILRILLVAGSFVLAIIMGALLLFGPKEHSHFHFSLAVIIIVSGTTLAMGSTELYKQAYEETELIDMEVTSWLIFALTICLFVSIIWFHSTKRYKIIADNSIAVFEILHWITFGIFVAILSTKPPLLVDNFCIASV